MGELLPADAAAAAATFEPFLSSNYLRKDVMCLIASLSSTFLGVCFCVHKFVKLFNLLILVYYC